MKRNFFLDIANTLCQMLYSRRLTVDRDELISLPAGIVTVDLLAGDAHHDSAGQLVITFGRVFGDRLRMRCVDEGIPITLVDSAILTISIDPHLPHPTDFLGPFDRWSARCEIVTSDRTYVGEMRELCEMRPCSNAQDAKVVDNESVNLTRSH